jgi:hypothetical protein
MMKVSEGYAYRGKRYVQVVDREDDNEKITHYAEEDLPAGKVRRTMMDWSPYSSPTVEEFQVWVDLGMPRRVGPGPLDSRDLIDMAKVSRMSMEKFQ